MENSSLLLCTCGSKTTYPLLLRLYLCKMGLILPHNNHHPCFADEKLTCQGCVSQSALKTGLKSTLCHSQAHVLNHTPYCFPILLAQPEMETSKQEPGKSLWPPPTLFTPRSTHNRILSAPPSQCPSDPSPCYSPVLASPPISTIHLSGIPFSPSLS